MRSQKKSKFSGNKNKLTITPNLRDEVKAGLRGKLIVIQAYLQKIETFFSLHVQLSAQCLAYKRHAVIFQTDEWVFVLSIH